MIFESDDKPVSPCLRGGKPCTEVTDVGSCAIGGMCEDAELGPETILAF